MTRRVVSLWLPRFATERQRSDPADSGGRPRVLVEGDGDRLTVAAVDARAAAAGLTPGLPLAEARAQVPGLLSEPHDPAADARALHRLAAWCGRTTPWTAPDGGHDTAGAAGVLLDVTGCAHLFGGEAALLDDLLARLHDLGLSARAGLAGTVGAAWALARFAEDTAAICPEGGERDALAPLPPEALRIAPAQAGMLRRLGLTRLDALCAIPPETLAPRVGRTVAQRLDQALGRAGEPVTPIAPAPPLRVRRGFAEPIGRRDDVAAAIEELAAALARRLETDQQGARRLALTLYRVDGSLQTVAVGTSRASREPAHLTRLLHERLDELDAGFGVEVATLAATAVERFTAAQAGLGTGREGDDLAALIDRLTARLGEGAVARPHPRDTHTPERAVTWMPPLSRPGAGAWPAVPPRPVRLFHPAPRLDVTGHAPDGWPRALHWGGLDHRVAAAEGLERLSPAWWRAPDARPRDHLRLETDAGRRLWAARHGEQWGVQGVFG